MKIKPHFCGVAAGAVLALSPLSTAWAQAKLLSVPESTKVNNEYIVVLKENAVSTLDAGSFVTQQAQLASLAGGTVTAEFHHAIQGFAISIDEDGVSRLLEQDNVDYIEPVQIFSINDVQNNPTWGLDRLDQQDRPLDNRYRYDYTGAGVNAYVIDTGINTSHTQFTGRIGSTVTTIGNDPEDCNGHGTHVAGTIGATTYGVAKNVTLHSIKVFGCSGNTTSTAIIQGIDWVAANARLPAVANMSLGGGASSALDQATNRLISAGVVTVVAAGNDNANACNYSPARVSGAITVGSTTSSDSRSNFSNFGRCVDIFAPGSSILSTWIGGSNATNSISGTSMASPHVAGVVALYLDKNGNTSPSAAAQAIYSNAATGKISGANGTVNRLVNTEFLFGGGNQNTPPQASFSVSKNGLTATFNDTSTDDNGVVNWSWNFGDGNTDSAQSPTHTYAQSGTYTVRLTVSDQEGLQSTVSQNVTVSDGNTGGCDGIAAWSDTTSYRSGDTVSFNGRRYTATWWSTGARPDIFSNVWRDDGQCGGNGGNQAPNADFSYSVSGLSVSFTDNSTDDKGITSWQWNFGDGQSATSANPSHQYAQAGNFSVQLTVSDAEGLSRSVTKLVSVSGNNQGCGGLAQWSSSQIYNNGDEVQYNNVRYRANWWSRGDNPAQNSGPWAVWTNLGACN